MFPFWQSVVAPLVKVSGAKRVLEIGALRGETTALMFEQLGEDSELHVIDPLPQFDPAEHEREFPGRYVFHRALSLDVLGDLPAFDVALIDGDHNWYTVFHELKQLHETARNAGQPLPICVLHDVAWPYGHRDLYYEPSQIPEEFRQPWERKGMAPGYYRLLEQGGLNAELANAVQAGGPRNGVMRALEDFLEDYDRAHRMVLLPFYFGLAIVVDEERIAADPRIGRLLDDLETAKGRERLLRLSERVRIDEQVHVHNWNRQLEARADRHRDRWLELLKAALHDEHYLENEVRLEYVTSLPPGVEPDPGVMRDPARGLPIRYDRLRQARLSGGSSGDLRKSPVLFPYTDMGRPATDHLQRTIGDLTDDVPGDLVECGVGRGGGGIFMRACLDAYGLADRAIWAADPYHVQPPGDQPEPSSDSPTIAQLERFRADLNQVRDGYDRFGLLDERVRFLQGPFDQSLVDAQIEEIAVLRIGAGIEDLRTVLERLVPKVVEGGTVVVEGVGEPPMEKRLAAVRSDLDITDELERVDWNTVAWTVGPGRRSERSSDEPTSSDVLHRVALAPSPPDGELLDLSVVVIFYDMRREAARTLRSLSRSYQRGIEDLRYEVIVIDNGSPQGGELDADDVASYGPEFRLVSLGDEAAPSPTAALNLGVSQSRGAAVALMIDGAHVLTPGVLRLGLSAMETYEPAIVATQQWYVGPGQQGDAQQAGYDQAKEDFLFKQIRWPVDGYRLFEIGHFIGDRDWFDGIVESNCLFAPRWLLEQAGAFDDSFAMPGGGYANLDLFERLGAHPGVKAASILGEGSFHQFHGGTTTNVADEAVRRDRVFSYGEHFRETRGRGLIGLSTPVHYVGSMDTKAARRTRSRRELNFRFDPQRDPVASTDTEPVLVPDDLKIAAIEAIWQRQAWRETTWLGHPVNRLPTDLHSAQEVVAQVRPDVIVLIGDDEGLTGRAHHLAAVTDQLGHGRIVTVTSDGRSTDDLVGHDRIDHLAGPATDQSTIDHVLDLVGSGSALVFIGLGSKERVLAAFDRYAPMVPVGSYVVIENTVVNGRPVEPSFGPGPHEAVVHVLGTRSQFVADVAFEKHTITFAKNGYLRRMTDD